MSLSPSYSDSSRSRFPTRPRLHAEGHVDDHDSAATIAHRWTDAASHQPRGAMPDERVVLGSGGADRQRDRFALESESHGRT